MDITPGLVVGLIVAAVVNIVVLYFVIEAAVGTALRKHREAQLQDVRNLHAATAGKE